MQPQKNRALPPKRERFCREYMIDLNATQAAIRAGYSVKTAGSQGERLLNFVDVRDRVAELAKTIDAKAEVNAERILAELMTAAHFDPAEIVGKVGSVDEIARLPEHVRRAIAGWTWDREGRLILKFYDKQKALELLGKYKTLWTDRTEVEHSGEAIFNMVYQEPKDQK
jgi:phage terminase small subunit